MTQDFAFAYLLFVEVSILVLNGVELVTEGQEVLISLLNFKDLCFQLRDEEILLIRSQVNTVVVL
jgi:hypothetical protein